jgi:FtsH-binding integral membrane protein
MIPILLILIGLFAIALVVRQITSFKTCALCFAVSVSWLIGLADYFSKRIIFDDPIILAILMGGSVVGLMYYLSSISPNKFSFFKFPYFITALFLINFVFSREATAPTVLLIVGIWLAFFLIFIFRDKNTKNWFQKILECCRNW